MRKIKTLLLCNIEHEEKDDVAEIYKNIYCGKTDGQSNCGRRYFALGNTDAFSIYDTPHTESAPHLSDIYEDKKTIKRNISQIISDQLINYTYHPIYLVQPDESGLKENRSDKLEQYAFCVVTLAYGISYGSFDYENKDYSKKSRFESRIKEFTDEIQKQLIADNTTDSQKDEKVRLLMYNAVNICDAVIMLYSNNLANALRIARDLTSKLVGVEGKARPVAEKTYTMVGFQITKDFEKDSFDGGSEENYPVKSKLSCDQNEYTLQVHGTVKNFGLFEEQRKKLFKDELDDKGAAMLGRDDFRYKITRKGHELGDYLNLLLQENESISKACQEIHTEFVFPSFDPVKKYKENTGGPISSFYDNANRLLHDIINSNKTVLPWILAYRELLANYQNIKNSPVLRDSAYIIYDFVKTVNAYIGEHTQSGRLDIPGNQEHASITIRNWISLTEQMTRVDDLIFTGFGHTPAITNTLPESILEYYHAVIRKLVDELLKWDEDYYKKLAAKRIRYIQKLIAKIKTAVLQEKTDESIQYDFLMVPALNQRFQIVQMFDADYEYRIESEKHCSNQNGCENCDQPQYCWRLRHWPKTQVYLINFSSEDLYRPVEFFPKLVHEVFHTFGDAFRCRGDRRLFAAMFLAAIWTRNINLNSEIPDQKEIDDIIYIAITNMLLEKSQNEPHLCDTMDALQKRLKGIRDRSSITEILKKIKEHDENNGTKLLDNNYGIFDEKFGLRWRSGFDKDWNKIIEQEEYLFKECFADVMMIHFLQLPVDDYIKLLRFETSQPIGSEKDGEWLVLQRFAAVISECYSENQKGAWNQFNESDVEDTIREIYGQTNGNPGDDLPQTKNADNLITLVQSLIKNENRRFNNGDIEKKTFPPLALKALCMYLNDAIKKFNETIKGNEVASSFITKVKESVNEETFFTPAYYRLIHERHYKIRSENKGSAS